MCLRGRESVQTVTDGDDPPPPHPHPTGLSVPLTTSPGHNSALNIPPVEKKTVESHLRPDQAHAVPTTTQDVQFRPLYLPSGRPMTLDRSNHGPISTDLITVSSGTQCERGSIYRFRADPTLEVVSEVYPGRGTGWAGRDL